MNQAVNHHVQMASGSSPDSGNAFPNGAHAFQPTDRRLDFPGTTAYRVLHRLLARQAGRESMEQVTLANRDQTRNLLLELIRESAEGIIQLERFAQLQPTIVLGERPQTGVGFPAGASSQSVDSVLAWRDSRLLLARSEALSHAWYLAGEAALSDQQLERSRYLRNLGALMKNLHRRTVRLMRSQLSRTEE